MTVEQVALLMAAIDGLRFLMQALVLTAGMGFGLLTWRLIVLAKNQRSIW